MSGRVCLGFKGLWIMRGSKSGAVRILMSWHDVGRMKIWKESFE